MEISYGGGKYLIWGAIAPLTPRSYATALKLGILTSTTIPSLQLFGCKRWYSHFRNHMHAYPYIWLEYFRMIKHHSKKLVYTWWILFHHKLFLYELNNYIKSDSYQMQIVTLYTIRCEHYKSRIECWKSLATDPFLSYLPFSVYEIPSF